MIAPCVAAADTVKWTTDFAAAEALATETS